MSRGRKNAVIGDRLSKDGKKVQGEPDNKNAELLSSYQLLVDMLRQQLDKLSNNFKASHDHFTYFLKMQDARENNREFLKQVDIAKKQVMELGNGTRNTPETDRYWMTPKEEQPKHRRDFMDAVSSLEKEYINVLDTIAAARLDQTMKETAEQQNRSQQQDESVNTAGKSEGRQRKNARDEYGYNKIRDEMNQKIRDQSPYFKMPENPELSSEYKLQIDALRVKLKEIGEQYNKWLQANPSAPLGPKVLERESYREKMKQVCAHMEKTTMIDHKDEINRNHGQVPGDMLDFFNEISSVEKESFNRMTDMKPSSQEKKGDAMSASMKKTDLQVHSAFASKAETETKAEVKGSIKPSSRHR